MYKPTSTRKPRSFSKFRLSSLSLSSSSSPSSGKQQWASAQDDDDTVILDDGSIHGDSTTAQKMSADAPILTIYVEEEDQSVQGSTRQSSTKYFSVDRSLELHKKEVEQARAASTKDFHSSLFLEDISSLEFKQDRLHLSKNGEKEEEEEVCSTEKTVRFQTVVIREYPTTVGDNGSVLQGPPLALDWKHLSQRSIDLESYEQARGPHRRQKREMVLSSGLRFQRLRDWGHSRSEIQAGTKVANVTRNHRKETNARIKEDIKDEKREERVQKLKNLATLGSIQRKERAYLKKHVPGIASGTRRYYLDETVHTI